MSSVAWASLLREYSVFDVESCYIPRRTIRSTPIFSAAHHSPQESRVDSYQPLHHSPTREQLLREPHFAREENTLRELQLTMDETNAIPSRSRPIVDGRSAGGVVCFECLYSPD